MKHYRVGWKHQHPDEPVLLYHEVDERGWETRKIEVWRSGKKGFASAAGEHGDTRLGVEPFPSLTEIARDPQFDPAEISQEEFEHAWNARLSPI